MAKVNVKPTPKNDEEPTSWVKGPEAVVEGPLKKVIVDLIVQLPEGYALDRITTEDRKRTVRIRCKVKK